MNLKNVGKTNRLMRLFCLSVHEFGMSAMIITLSHGKLKIMANSGRNFAPASFDYRKIDDDQAFDFSSRSITALEEFSGSGEFASRTTDTYLI